MTQIEALAYLIENAPTNTPAPIIEAASQLLIAKTKKYDRGKSPERRMNEAIVPEFVELMKAADESELINSIWLFDRSKNPAITSPQKVRAVVDIAIQNGIMEKHTVKRRVYYKLAEGE